MQTALLILAAASAATVLASPSQQPPPCDDSLGPIVSVVTSFSTTASAAAASSTVPTASAVSSTTASAATTASPAAKVLTLTAAESSIVAGGFLTFSWKNAKPSSSDDWIVFTPSGKPSESNFFKDCWQYTYGDTYKLGTAATASGSISVKVPATPGTYTAFYCLNGGFDCPASVKVTVTAPQVTCRAKGTTASAIQNVVIVISENHSFDSYFGNYCTAPAGSNPTCHEGRECCAAITPSINGVKPIVLNDVSNMAYDNDHHSHSEICEMNGGKMDRFIKSGGCPGSDDRNYAACDGTEGSCGHYWEMAKSYAMSDNFFQAVAGASSANDMYFARGGFVFEDNGAVPPSTKCNLGGVSPAAYSDPTIADLLAQCDVPFTFYAQDYSDELSPFKCWPVNYDPSDNPFEYYGSLRNSSKADDYFRAYPAFLKDVVQGTLPAVSYIKARGIASEHPGYSTISAGETINKEIIASILNSPIYSKNTLVLLVPDESGGFRDSVSPPGRSAVDNKLYGPRIPFVAVGNMVKKSYISHVRAEPASIVRFIESNWFADAVPGQLRTRDAVAGSFGDMFDAGVVGFEFP
ncbi:hypothetical protein HDU81_010143 [Chytriomyces hyalinus]|nr:hypothetical protein HDU81_010143 [Chytriomyces hyalinus]